MKKGIHFLQQTYLIWIKLYTYTQLQQNLTSTDISLCMSNPRNNIYLSALHILFENMLPKNMPADPFH